jgi:hypothetical protein
VTHAVGAEITTADLRAIGEIESFDPPSVVIDRTVFQLEGVDPAQLFVMRSPQFAEGGTYILLYRREAVPRGEPVEEPDVATARFVNAFPGLCKYFREVPCPS